MKKSITSHKPPSPRDKGKILKITWVDTYNFLGWRQEYEIDDKDIKREFQQTVGFYIKEVGQWYILAMHHNPNHELGFPEWGNICYIPKSAVRGTKRL